MSKGVLSLIVLIGVIGLVIVAAGGLLLAKYSLKTPEFTASQAPQYTTPPTPYPSASPQTPSNANAYSATTIDSDISGIDTKMKALDADQTNIQNGMNDKPLLTE